MPRQNRVNPFGEIITISERGTFVGNRGVLHDEEGRIRRVAGAMPFTLVSVLASLTGTVAAGVGVFVVSTFDTDYLFVKDAEFEAAVEALRGAGHSVEGALP